MAEKRDKKNNKKDLPVGLTIPAGLFVGMGIGFLTDNLVAWMFIGLGIGFIGMLVAHALMRKKR